ncbi:MAG TPA: glycosyltransferase [Bradyrhizobium sp.]|uniref:CgeB family protein n=1 Tax=Bradyrhizobium sp. TaxID=376 RepID=UPI002D7F3B77|nr:glycosyltransferase [Bradyrhizobium sp.]HET7889733.1 glycosyltransferase [Bradyrhizobium sp.]
MKCVLFYHAFSSCWNNGNAHFLRGVARELQKLGHEIIVYEPVDGWSRRNAIDDGGEQSLSEVLRLFPLIDVRQYDRSLDLDEALDGADLVLVHEWNSPEIVAEIGSRRAQGSPFTLLFHDTHHRAVTAPRELERFELDGFDGVLAFGGVLREIYLRLGWANRVFTWHEAADVDLYRPLPNVRRRQDVVWIGNWGDDERAAELQRYLIEPISSLRLRGTVYGVRYPQSALEAIAAAGMEYGGWLPAHRAPVAFARARATVHVPRGPYARSLPGIPTIRMFEAMACGIPVVSSPWEDIEHLFTPGTYLRVSNGEQMQAALRALLCDADFAEATTGAAYRLIVERHTCRHRAIELLDIVEGIRTSRHVPAAAFCEEPAS